MPAKKNDGSGRRPPSARPRRSTRKGSETRIAILEAAVDAINRYGIRGINLTRVAKQAGVTRGCLQYYFLTTADIILALALHVEQENWRTYLAGVKRASAGRSLVESAIDMVGNPVEDRYRAARLELIVAARTMPALRPVLEKAAREVENIKRAFTDELFGRGGVADTPRFRGARDLTAIVDDWMFLHVFPGERAARIAGVREALRIALHALWGLKGARKAK